MNRKTFFMVLTALWGLTMIACQKEQAVVKEQATVPQCSPTAYTLSYMVDGNVQLTSFQSTDELNTFVLNLMSSVGDGHTVTLLSDNYYFTTVPTKDVLIFRTVSDTVAAAWATEKFIQGYNVTVKFDTETNEYVCMAEIKTSSHNNVIMSSLAGTEWLGHHNNLYLFLSFETDSTGVFLLERQQAGDITGIVSYFYDSESECFETRGEDTNGLRFYFILKYDESQDALVQVVGAPIVYNRVYE